jgi:cytochrome c oxidase subunit II
MSVAGKMGLRLGLVAVPLTLSGCQGMQSALDPASLQGRQFSGLWWLFFAVLTVIYVLVLAPMLILALRRPKEATPIMAPEGQREWRMGVTVSTAVGISVLILFVLLVNDFLTGSAMHYMADPNPLKIKVIGHQWWWEIQYDDPVPSQMMTTANEIHVPIGKDVQFDLRSVDVIHSFWAPNFHGKKDLIPGHPTTNWFRADRAGTFRGQCAEFCGLQHAHMRFVIVAEPADQFQAWLEAQRKPGAKPTTDEERRGERIFLSSTCIMCHTVQGTPARGMVGPDLTHVGSRPMIAAGTLPNRLGHLAGWITDPQQIKPGVRMPQHQFSPDDLRALAAYLENLK